MNAKWLVKQYLSDIKASLLDIKPDPILKQNKRFQNLHKGERGFILGSGHSIKEQDLTRLKGEIVITQNHFHAHEQIRTINPTYHVNVPKYQPKEFDNDWITWLQSMDERLPKETVIFFGKNTKYLVDQSNLFAGRAYYIQTGYTAALINRAAVDITRRIMVVPTVLTECLAIALYMGFKEIYLVGFDLDQICRLQNRENIRFYGMSPITTNRADITGEQALWISGEEWLNYWVIWKQCHLLKEAAKKQESTIINATRGGLLAMFERRVFEEIL